MLFRYFDENCFVLKQRTRLILFLVYIDLYEPA